jgi:hypothetical protein
MAPISKKFYIGEAPSVLKNSLFHDFMIKIKQGMSGATIQWTKMAVPLVQ